MTGVQTCALPIFLHDLKRKFKVDCLKYNRLSNNKIQKIAICGGAGAFLLSQAINSGADAFITGEIRYHDYFGHDKDILMIEIGHFESEQYTVELLYDIITDCFAELAVQISDVNTNPIKYLL